MPDQIRYFDEKPGKNKVPRDTEQFSLGLCLGLIGIDFVLLQGLLSLQADLLTIITALLIMISIASNSAAALLQRNNLNYGFYFIGRSSTLQAWLPGIGSACTVIAIGMVGWHISWIVGTVFIVSVLIVSLLVAIFDVSHASYLEKEDRERQEQPW